MRVLSGLLFLVLAAPSGSEEADTQLQGRLFTTPAERRMLDKLRDGVGEETVSRKPVPVVRQPPPSAEPLRFDGVVVRSGGPDTVWVDGKPVALGVATSSDLRVAGGTDASGAITLQGPEQSRTVRLKPGQRYDPETGNVTEAFHTVAEPRRHRLDGP